MSFSNIKGQDKAIRMLQGYLERSRLEGGYLFTGPEGVGKKLAAKTLAKAVNCLEGNFDPCDSCDSCRKIENNRHPDVHIFESGESEIKIEYIRQLQREVNLKPYEGRTKVFIIDNAHRLTAEASNALLKILEEPAARSLIILISDKPALLFKTIISRCKTLKFAPLKRAALQEILKKDYSIDNNLSYFLAYFSEGRIGRALRLKDTDILRRKNKVIDSFAFSKTAEPASLPMQNKEEVRDSLNILATWFRDIYLIKIGMPHSEVINFDRKDDLLGTMARFTTLDLNEILDSICDSILYLEQNINIKLLLYNLGAQIWRG
jgi:DNA polymerase-3 subunit delta'